MAHDPLAWLDGQLAELETRSLRRTRWLRAGAVGASCTTATGTTLINFGSNDYLGLAAEARVRTAAIRATSEVGWGAGASPLVSGYGEHHATLELSLARFEGTAAALLFPTGYAANVGTIASLVGPGDVIFSDAKNHASIIDGCRLSGARIEIYRHNELDHLLALLNAETFGGRRLIVTDGLFSMDGDLAPLAELAQVAEEHRCMLMVDEAHATGVLGEQGRGATELCGAEQGVHIRIGTFSKALGSHGGFVVGSQRLIDWLVNRARTYIFSTASPMATAAAAASALQLVEQEPQRRNELLDLAAWFRSALIAAGWNVGTSQSQIVPILLGDSARALAAAQHLREAGFYVPAIRPPSVPVGEALLRVSLCWGHTQAMLERLIEVLRAGPAGIG